MRALVLGLTLALVLTPWPAGRAARADADADSDSDRTARAVAEHKAGLQAYRAGDLDGAIARLRSAHAEKPTNLIRFDLARVLVEKADTLLGEAAGRGSPPPEAATRALYEEAKRLLDAALVTWDDDANVYYVLSRAEVGLGLYGPAADHLEKAIELGSPQGPVREKLEATVAELRAKAAAPK